MPRARRGRGGAGRQNTLPAAAMTTSSKSPKAASSSEKETPTVVLTAMTSKNISPYNLSTNCDDNPSSSKMDKRDNVEGGRIAVMEHKRKGACNNDNSTQKSTYSTRKKFRHDLSDEESLEGGDEDADMKKKFRDEFIEESSGEDEDDCLDNIFDDEQLINAIQNLLQGGIASICRLRKLFPASFFETFDLDGTSVSQFNVAFIEQALRKSVNGNCDDEECEYDGDDDMEDRSMMKSISTKKSATQKSLSPLTGASQWLSPYEAEASQRGMNPAPPQPDFGKDDEALKKWQKQAMEALTLVQWMGKTTKFLSEGKLARIIFGICDGNELIESYSFQLSFVEQSQTGGLQMTQFQDSTGSFFRNLNGFSAGSGTLLPSKTQSSFLSQGFTQASSQYLTQNVATSQSVGLTQQRSIFMTMSQSVRSVRASAKNFRAYQIPDSRYLSLDVKFTDEIEVDDLPDIFREQEDDTASPFPTEDDQFVVTPIGTISESCLKVDLHAYSKSDGDGRKEDEDDDKSVHFSQYSHSRPDPAFDAERSASSESETSDSEDSDSQAYAIPKGLAGEDVYLPCKFLGHRQSTEVDGDGKEEFKLKFDNKILTTKGMKKQWILAKNVYSSSEMHTMIKQAFKQRRINKAEKKESITTFDVESIAQTLKVETDVVKHVAERVKRKMQDETNITQKRQKNA